MNISEIACLFLPDEMEIRMIPPHDGGRNTAFVCGDNRFILRISETNDRAFDEYLAEAEFVHYLASNGAPVADVVLSKNGNFVEQIGGAYAMLFRYADGIGLADNGYRYRDGAPIEEYYYNTGKALGVIHRLSKAYRPTHARYDYFDKYTPEYIDRLIPDEYAELKHAITDRLAKLASLPHDGYGTVHFDFNDGNYNIDMATGRITVFDFDNSCRFHYLFDLATLWLGGTGWCMGEANPKRRMAFMRRYFDTVLAGYGSETEAVGLENLPLFVDAVLIEGITDCFERAERSGEKADYADIADDVECLIKGIPYAGIGE